uniref:Toll-like receptor n=2 Tax=Capra hircus TaxID=9925 RepID=A0A452FN74_CAPHI
MIKDKESPIRSCHFVYIVALVFGTIIQFSDESEFVVDMSKTSLVHVPKDLPPNTKVLDLSQNNISELHLSDVSFLSGLKVLRLSHNRIQGLDISIFKFNHDLEYLDLSHNQLQKISCHPITTSLKHLDLSFNDFDALPICKEFGNLTQLNFLGLSATKLEQLDLLPVAHLHLSCILLDLEDYYMKENKKESLQILNTKKLHLVFHPNSFFSVQVKISVNSLGCLQLTNIKVNDDNCQVLLKFLSELTGRPTLLNFTLNHMETTWKCLVKVFQFLWPKPVEYLNIYNLTIVKSINEEDFTYYKTTLKSLKIEYVTNEVFIFSQTALYTVFSEMNIPMLTISDTPFIHMLCPQEPSTFKFLNFTQNAFTDSVFQNCDTLTRLETLILQKNELKDLFKTSLMTKGMLSLETLDVSWNSLEYDRRNGNCTWVGSIVVLNLSSNALTDSVFRCLPPRIKVLDLHNNRIRSIPKDVTGLETLQELNLASNSLAHLPGCGILSSLSILIIDYNSISSPSADFFQSCQKIRSLKAGNNPFQCSCELREFIQSVGQVSSDVVEGWPESYKCDYPESYQGTPLKDFHVSELSCNTALLIVTIVVPGLVLAVAVTVLCIYLDLPWYLRMVCQWTQTRRRARNVPLEERQRTLQFHAFISYSEHDSAWVKNELIPNLEKEDIRICLHERNFVAGKSIVENIINCIEKRNNPFQCSCELREFIQSVGQVSSDVVEGWPESYKCDYPESYKGTPLKDFHVSELSCNTALLIVTIVVPGLVLAVAVTVLCIYLDLPWYLRMVCQWTQTRRRARNVPLEERQRTLQFHAFISYSGHDSAWVKNELIPNLEKEDIRICLHERNFVAGKSIVENIINCIEKSYKSIFVLSPNFVQSEWCHYELYFAHHNLFHEGSDNLILILLEPIPQYSIPSSYHKLRALMAQRTYLEWPKEKSKHGLFWANLRASINIKLMGKAAEVRYTEI